MGDAATIWNEEVIVSLITMTGILGSAYIAALALLPRSATSVDRFTFVWLIFDGLTHALVEGAFLYYSTFGRTVFSAKPGNAFGTSLPTVVSLEILTVLIGAPLCFLIAIQIVQQKPIRHYWIIVLSTGELYGGFMTFAPEWLTGSPNLSTHNFLYLYVYLAFFNLLWVWIPGYLMWDSYNFIARRLEGKSKAQ